MTSKITTILKKLKEIEPDASYTKRSRLLILAEAPQKTTPAFRLTFSSFFAPAKNALIIVGALALIVLGAGFYLSKTFSDNGLIAEAGGESAKIQINLNDIQYLIQSKNSLDPQTANAIRGRLEKAKEELEKANVSIESNDAEETLRMIKAAKSDMSSLNQYTK